MIDLASLALERARAKGLGESFIASGLGEPYPAPRALVVFLPYCVEPGDSVPEQLRVAPSGSFPAFIAPFARRHWYAHLAAELKGIAAELRGASGLPKSAFRVACNSKLPERALGATRGSMLRNGLLFSEGLGSLFIIGALFVPGLEGEGGGEPSVRPGSVPSPGAISGQATVPAPPLHPRCASCGACAEACPAGAIAEGYDKERCLQRHAAVDAALPATMMEAWGPRLYGCQACQAVCPLNRGLGQTAPPPGLATTGEGVEALDFLRKDDDELDVFLFGSAMGLSWVSRDALRRNALLAALHWARRGAGGEDALLERCARHRGAASAGLAAAAAYVEGRLRELRRSAARRP